MARIVSATLFWAASRMYARCAEASGVAVECAVLCALAAAKRAPTSARSTRASDCARRSATCGGKASAAAATSACPLPAHDGGPTLGASSCPSGLASIAALVPRVALAGSARPRDGALGPAGGGC
eukprot:6213762-Pleurochrysis_carterae.AAC.3